MTSHELAAVALDPQVLFSLLPVALALTSALAAVGWVGFLLFRRPADAPYQPPPPQVEPPAVQPNERSAEELASAQREISRLTEEITLLEQKLLLEQQATAKEQERRGQIESEAERLTHQFEEVLHEIEQIYQQNLGVSAFEDLSQRISMIRKGVKPADKGTTPEGFAPAPNQNPEKLLISEQAAEIRRLKDVVVFYKEKYGE